MHHPAHIHTTLHSNYACTHTNTRTHMCTHIHTHVHTPFFLSSQRHFCHLKNTFALSGQTLSQEALMFMTSNLLPAFADRNFSTNTQCIPHVCPLMGKEACSQDHHCLSSTVPPSLTIVHRLDIYRLPGRSGCCWWWW